MDAVARAGIDIFGSVMRYAEVEQYGTRYRLLRLGSCDFEFDVFSEVFSAPDPTHLDTVAEAIGDVFTGTISTQFRVSVHPPVGIPFFSPVPPDLPERDRHRRLHHEAALLAGPDATLELLADPTVTETLADGSQVMWTHVLALEKSLQERLSFLLRALPQAPFRPMVSMQGIALALQRLSQRGALTAEAQPFTLALGCYPTHLEYVLCYNGVWFYSHHTPPGTPVDAAFFTLALFRHLRIDPRHLGRLFVYGVEVDMAAYKVCEKALGLVPELLNVVPVVDLDPQSLAASFDVEAYAPCIGVAL